LNYEVKEMTTLKPNILFLDDEVRIVTALKALFRTDYNVFTATDPRTALKLVKENTIHVVVSDQRMPVMLGVEVLRQIKEVSPKTMRVLLTGYSDMEGIVGSVNDGEVFRYVSKPWNNEAIRATIRQAAQVALKLSIARLPAQITGGTAPDVVVLDNDNELFKTVDAVYSKSAKIHRATNVRQAMDLLKSGNIGVMLSDLRVGNEDVSVFLKTLRENYPLVVTIVFTGVMDGETVVGLINEAQIFRLLPKPPKNALVRISIESAMQRYSACKFQPILLDRYQGQATKEKELTSPHILDRLKSLRSRFIAPTH
jgi:DNA-binding NtrC family response regulator